MRVHNARERRNDASLEGKIAAVVGGRGQATSSLFLVAVHKTELGRWNVDIFLLLLLLPLMLFIAGSPRPCTIRAPRRLYENNVRIRYYETRHESSLTIEKFCRG